MIKLQSKTIKCKTELPTENEEMRERDNFHSKGYIKTHINFKIYILAQSSSFYQTSQL